MRYEYVIVGNSAAAAGCIEGIREYDKKGTIAVISDEPYHIYSRPLISYKLKGQVTEENMKYRPDDYYSVNAVDAILGRKAVSADGRARTLELDDGGKIEYSKLLIATGSKPFVPPINGLDGVENKFCFMKLDDVKAIEKAVKKGSRVLIIGAGLIGLKAAEALERFECDMTVIDLADRILPSILDKPTSEIMRKHIEAHGVKFMLGTTAERFEGNTAYLTNGESRDFDLLITAVGVRPNTELAESAGGKAERGIVTDKKQAVKGVKNIWAAGDCTVSDDITSGTSHIIAVMPNAYAQGLVAGHNMAGGHDKYENAFPMNAIGFFGLHIITAGTYSGECFEESDGENVKKLFCSDGRLNGFILMGGKTAKAGIYTALIREKTPLSSIDRELVYKEPGLAAFPSEKRHEILSEGGETA